MERHNSVIIEVMNHAGLWDEFHRLNQSKRWVQSALTPVELKRWKNLRMEIEKILCREVVFPSKDCRDSIRFPTALEVFYRVEGELRQRSITTLGEGGCFIACPDPLDRGADLILDIALPRTAERLTLRGKVVWTSNRSSNPGMGIQFIHLIPEQKAPLFQFIDSQISAGLGIGKGS